ncbi:hypothetical protein ACHAXN_005529 [Cyclotella atomus]|jgi:hypothetical protein
MKPKIDIFRRCRGAEPSNEFGHLHCTIFRSKKRQDSSRSGQTANKASTDDDSIVLSFPAGVWPPNQAIAGSESTDTKSTSDKRGRLNRSIPLQVESSESRGTITPITNQLHPSYYKIEMQGSQVQLSAGDDNSIQITPDHNHNIQATGPKRNITRASPIAEQGFESPVPPLKAHEMDHKWTVSENGDIVAIQAHHVLSKPPEPSLSFHSKLGVPSLKDSDSTPPILTKASSDSISEASHELTLPESPPRMNRSVYDKSLFEESSRSSSGTRSRATKTPSPVNDNMIEIQNIMEDMPEETKNRGGCGRTDFMGHILDFFNLACGTVVCRDANCLSSENA